jgi:excisionase family DNA binding protein
MFKNYPEIITVDELQEILFIGKNQAYNLLRRREIQAVKIGKVWRIPIRAVFEFLGYEPDV